ncbi:MAG: hypothetical protein QOJ37_2972, partial [Pseudonocardiales bacterium]|nr:hypothetical protein [Pseudonocardiales bacterium]
MLYSFRAWLRRVNPWPLLVQLTPIATQSLR